MKKRTLAISLIIILIFMIILATLILNTPRIIIDGWTPNQALNATNTAVQHLLNASDTQQATRP